MVCTNTQDQEDEDEGDDEEARKNGRIVQHNAEAGFAERSSSLSATNRTGMSPA
jgi:hypothetical protein